MSIERCRGNRYRSTIVCIDSYEDRILGGRYYNPGQKDGAQFFGLMEFLLKMEQMLNMMELPQSFTSPRTFIRPTEPVNSGTPGNGHSCGKLATFEVKILFRQNASWQGCVTWLEKGKEERFRSVLELAILMDSALTAQSKARTTA